jgi:hypothetical protein
MLQTPPKARLRDDHPGAILVHELAEVHGAEIGVVSWIKADITFVLLFEVRALGAGDPPGAVLGS